MCLFENPFFLSLATVQKAKVVKGEHHKEILINGHVLSHHACNNVQILHLVLWHDLYMVYLYCIFWKKYIYLKEWYSP